jgi:hypothetical protein
MAVASSRDPTTSWKLESSKPFYPMTHALEAEERKKKEKIIKENVNVP